MDHGLGVVAEEGLTAAAAGVRLAVERLADLLGRDQTPLGPCDVRVGRPASCRRGRWRLRFMPIGSDEGGLEELVELSLSRASRSATRGWRPSFCSTRVAIEA